ncbi:hypothetical protein IMCC1909_00620 [Rhodobacteraceae bacterium IMCC1909]|nr:hypothetical protein [Rhodobacteraceae bacterium IMCC1923]MDP4069601.1 hypothetical protein [Rhodobacteraceae bacterium IMCC1909]
MKNVMAKNILAAGLISIATSALAIDAADIINRMETRGYTDIETSTTLFGNTLIVGIKDGSKHEFVINKSGVVLREDLRETFKQSFWGGKIFSIFDVDGDGNLSAKERTDAKNKIVEKIDTDGDGQLSDDERSTARSNVREKIRERLSNSSNNASNN